MEKEVGRSAELRKLKQEISRKLLFLEHKAVIDYREVYTLIRQFFKEYLERDYEFTIRELRDEVKKTYIPATVREDVSSLLDTLEQMEYKTVSYKREELLAILKRFRKVVDELVKTIQRRHSIWNKIRAFIFKEEQEPIVISDLPVIEQDDAQHVHMNLLLEKTYLFISQKSKRKAKHQYGQMLEYYGSLEDHVKQEFYPLVDEAYSALVEMMK